MLTVDPSLHLDQYPKFYPLKLRENASKDIISSWIK
jgi:hypothetical protein